MSEVNLFACRTIHQVDQRFSSLSRGRQCCFMGLSALLFELGSQVCQWTAENVDHILSVGDKMYLYSLQKGLIPDTETLSINKLPSAVRWIAESNTAIVLQSSQTRTQLPLNTAHFGQKQSRLAHFGQKQK